LLKLNLAQLDDNYTKYLDKLRCTATKSGFGTSRASLSHAGTTKHARSTNGWKNTRLTPCSWQKLTPSGHACLPTNHQWNERNDGQIRNNNKATLAYNQCDIHVNGQKQFGGVSVTGIGGCMHPKMTTGEDPSGLAQ
jgi:hypothetical protein